jgi:hypothetical protein
MLAEAYENGDERVDLQECWHLPLILLWYVIAFDGRSDVLLFLD